MELHVEINVVYWPLEEPEMCTIQFTDRPLYDEKMKSLLGDKKHQVLGQKGEIHMIKIGPVTEEFLSTKKLNPSLDFLQGVQFTLTEDNVYLWTSGEEVKGLPISSKYQLLSALIRMGYMDPRYNAYFPSIYVKVELKLFYAIKQQFSVSISPWEKSF